MAALGRLVAEIGLDAAEFTAGLKRAEKGFADFERSIGEAAKGAITSFAGQLLSLQAASALASSAIAAFTDTVKGMAALDDAAEKTGATVESLAKLQVQAKISGQSFEGIESALIKLNKGLVNADDETKGAGRALEFLGIKARDSSGKLRDAGDITLEVAKKFNEFSDKGPGKAALAIELFGKAGAQALPYLKDLGENVDNLKDTFAGNTEAADKYEKAINGLTVQKEQLRRVIVSELLPAAEDFVNALLDMKKRGDGLAATVKELAADGSLERWARQGALFIAEMIDQTIYAGQQFIALGKDLQGLALLAGAAFDKLASGAATAFARITRSQTAMAEAMQLESSANDKYTRAMTAFAESTAIASKESTKFADAVLSRQIERMSASADATSKAGVEFEGYGGKVGKAKKEVDDFAKKLETLLAKINGKDAGLDASFGKDVELLTLAFQRGAINVDSYNGAIQKLARQQPVNIALDKAMWEGLKKLAEAAEEEYKLTLKNTDALEDKATAYNAVYSSMSKQLATMNQEIQLLGLVGAAREKELVNIRLKIDLQGIEDANARTALETKAEELKAAIDAREQGELAIKQFADQAAAAKQAESDLAGYFETIFLNGKKAFDNLGQTVKQFFAKMASQFAAKFVLNILASVTGGAAGGAANAASSLFGEGGGSGIGGAILSGLSSLIGGSGFAAAGGVFSSVLAGTGSILQGLTAGLSSLTGGATAFLGVLGPIGLAIGAIAAIAASLGLFKNKTGIKIDNSVTDGRGRKDIVRGAALGDFDVSGDIGNAAFKPLIDTVLSLDKYIADNLLTKGTIDTVRANIQRISSDATDWFGFEDAAGAKVAIEKASKLFLQQRYSVAFDEIDANVGNLIRGFQGSADELIAYISKLATGAVVIGKLNTAVPGLNLSLLSFSQLSDKAQQSVVALALSLSSFDTDTNAAVGKIIKAQQMGSITAYGAAGDAIAALRVKLNDGTIGIEQFAAGVGQLATAYAAATAKIAETRTALAELFAGSQENFRLAPMGNEEKYAYFQKQAEDLFKQLESATDPEAINRLARQIDALQNNAFGILDDKARKDLAGEFVSASERTEALVYARLEAAGKALDKQNADLKTVIASALSEFAAKIKATADQESATADRNADTARQPIRLSITVDKKGEIEVNQ